MASGSRNDPQGAVCIDMTIVQPATESSTFAPAAQRGSIFIENNHRRCQECTVKIIRDHILAVQQHNTIIATDTYSAQSTSEPALPER